MLPSKTSHHAKFQSTCDDDEIPERKADGDESIKGESDQQPDGDVTSCVEDDFI